MNAYKFYIWKSCYLNNSFTHNSERTQIIHARNSIEAEKRVNLNPEYDNPELHIRCSKEYIYNRTNLGTVKRVTRTYFEYSGNQSPMLESEYRKQLLV